MRAELRGRSGAGKSKLALAILSVLSPEDLVEAITNEDVDRIDAVPGVGPKVAERCVRELRDKISALNVAVTERPSTFANGHGGISARLEISPPEPGTQSFDGWSDLFRAGKRWRKKTVASLSSA